MSARIPDAADLRGRFVGRLVVVEPLAVEHEAGLFDAAQEGELFRWMPLSIADSPAQLHDWVQRSLEASRTRGEVPFTVLDAATGLPIGSTRFLEIRLEHLRVEIGWTWMARRVWGNGHNVEAKLLLLSHAFEHVRCRRVEFKTDARNERSRGALLALGATFEGTFRKHMVVRDGSSRDSAYYAIIDDDWPRVKALLQTRLAAIARDP
ncbi:MAG TPA: GNAT family protein [Solirubrobacteraceae bacterium]|nr:GNAT family protein [Solirubrobacteraceae bacterium]